MSDFLGPLVGIDPSSIRVHDGPAAAGVAGAYRADAVTIGNDVLIGERHPRAETDAPETLGLLAHELTHVARAQVSDLVPPVVAATGPPRGAGAPQTVASGAEPATEADEEALATLVEARVIDVARSRANTGAPPAFASADANAASAEEGGTPTAPAGAWDDVPAPWEPLPVWLRPASPSAPSVIAPPELSSVAVPEVLALAASRAPAAPAAAAAAPATPAPVGAVGPAGTPAAAGAVGAAVFTAEQDRDMPADSGAPPTPGADAGAAPSETDAAVTPDLDALARQVYGVLKRRLSAEQRRSTWS